MADVQTACFQAAQQVIDCCRSVAWFSETPGATTRTFLCDAMNDSHAFLRSCMESAGMKVTLDRVGNLRGYYPGETAGAPTFVLGSHLDTVPNAGAFDGVLGVAIGISLVQLLGGRRLPYALEIVGFSEEEGIRFGIPFIGSLGWLGELPARVLEAKDKAGISVRETIQRFRHGVDGEAPNEPSRRAGFLEFHIEQGPVLDTLGLPVAPVTAIAGQTRASVTFRGSANHAGTTPMHLRKDAAAAIAEWILAVEGIARSVEGLVATVGALEVLPGASNVIAGECRATLDVRHADDSVRNMAAQKLLERAEKIAGARRLTVEHWTRMNQRAVPMDACLLSTVEKAFLAVGLEPHRTVSGAGHDAMIIAEHMPAAMVFVRSPGGISHHPAETVLVEDVEMALRVGLTFLDQLIVEELR
jgi:allantoate deiminase